MPTLNAVFSVVRIPAIRAGTGTDVFMSSMG